MKTIYCKTRKQSIARHENNLLQNMKTIYCKTKQSIAKHENNLLHKRPYLTVRLIFCKE